jgi:hypothetical protein
MIARFAIVVVTVLTTWPAFAQTMTADMARRFVMGKLFAFNCFDGSRGAGRIYADGSVIGTIQFRGAGPVRSVWLPAGTLRVRGDSYCAALKGMAFEPCFELSRTSSQSFRGSLSGFSLAYCDFTRRVSVAGIGPRARSAGPQSLAAPGTTAGDSE